MTYQQPGEWELHDSCWLAWPSDGDLWQENLEPAQAEFSALARAITGIDYPESKSEIERLEVLVPDPHNRRLAEIALAGLPVSFHLIPFGDIWLRDTAPIFVRDGAGKILPARFAFNGWGGKYSLKHDPEVSKTLSMASGLPGIAYPFVLEGGSIEVDGEGTLLTSRQCLLNPNRNPELTQGAIETELGKALGISKFLWLGDGLLNDHTDGHVDTIARFIRPGVVLCMKPTGAEDPNTEVLNRIASDLRSFTDARGRALEVVQIPSPGKMTDEEGKVLPASYVNFYIANRTVVVPTYGAASDAAAVEAIAAQFPNHRTIGLSAKAILSGGGAFHCITQQQPRGNNE